MGAKGIAKGMPPPPQLVNNAISLLCVSLNAWVFLTNGRAASAMAVVTFLCLSLQLIAVRKPRFSQLSSSVFGLVYCGAWLSQWVCSQPQFQLQHSGRVMMEGCPSPVAVEHSSGMGWLPIPVSSQQ